MDLILKDRRMTILTSEIIKALNWFHISERFFSLRWFWQIFVLLRYVSANCVVISNIFQAKFRGHTIAPTLFRKENFEFRQVSRQKSELLRKFLDINLKIRSKAQNYFYDQKCAEPYL
jgi:hypothetical protein